LPDLLILVLMMPGVDGPSVLRSVRARGLSARVIVISAVADQLPVGEADACLRKPVDHQRLVQTMRDVARSS
jgi:DNA-binding response OmpR family regulator